MLGSAIDRIDYPTLIRFLETGVREGPALDFKRDFPSTLEKTLAAFANTNGGVILIGVDETPTGGAQLPIIGIPLKPGLRERVLQIALDAIYPPVLPEVRVVEFKSSEAVADPNRAVVIVRVHESEDAPHAIDNRTVVYLRADNVSDRYRMATMGELEWLFNKRQRSVEEKSRLLARVDERAVELRIARRKRRTPETYRGGAMRLWTIPRFPRKPLADCQEWARIVRDAQIQIPVVFNFLPNGSLQLATGGIFYNGPYGYSDFQQQGLIFHEFDYWWDFYGPMVSPGARKLFPKVTAALMWGTLELSRRIYRQAGYAGSIQFRFEADGIDGSYFTEPGAESPYDFVKMLDSRVEITRRSNVAGLEDGTIQIARECQRELYWAFGFDVHETQLDQDFAQCLRR